MKSLSISNRKFVYCHSYEKEIPIDNNTPSCCEFYNASINRCDYSKYVHSSHKRLSERDEIYSSFTSNCEDEHEEEI